MNFAQKLLSHHSSLFVAIPYLLLVAGAVGLQYLQMSRLNARNPQASQANPQAAMLQKYMPLIFGFIYLNVAAILNVYFIVSSAIRILTQEILFRKGIVAGPPRGRRAGAGCQEGPGGRPDRAGAAEEGSAVDRTEAGRRGRGANGTGTTAKAHRRDERQQREGSGPTGKATAARPRSRGPAKPTGSTNGSNGRKGTGSGRRSARAGPSNGARAPATGATDLGPQTRTTRVRPNRRSIPAPRRSVRERPGKQVEWVEASGKSLPEAKEIVLDLLGVAEDDAEFVVLSEPKAGLFGRLRGEARVQARVRPVAPPPKRGRRPKSDRRRSGGDRPRNGGGARKSGGGSVGRVGSVRARSPEADRPEIGWRADRSQTATEPTAVGRRRTRRRPMERGRRVEPVERTAPRRSSRQRRPEWRQPSRRASKNRP